MNTKKTLLVALSAVIATAAHAQYTSPEMALVTDFGGTTKSGGTVKAQVERYDTTTGQYLGAFGAGYLHSPTGVQVVGQEAYVTDTFTAGGSYFSKIDKFNFSTGAFDGSIFNSSPYYLTGTASYNGNILATDIGNPNDSYNNAGIYTLAPNGNQVGFLPTNSGFYLQGIVTDASNAYLAIGGTNGGLLSVSLNADGTYNDTNFETFDGQFFGVTTTTDGNGNERIYAGGDNTSETAGLVNEYDTSGNLIGSFTDTTGLYNGFATGHHGVVYGLEVLNGGGDSIQRFDNNLNVDYGSMGGFNLDYTAAAYRVGIYAAPEPISTSAIMLGLGGLMLRRRKRA